MSKIGLLSDSINFPSLPLMKISAYHKSLGDCVEIVTNFFEKYDKVYISKTFNLELSNIPRLDYTPQADEIEYGGSGYAIKIIKGKEIYDKKLDKNLPDNIENQFPDYELYKDKFKDTAYGFLTRGCCNNCEFCIVAKKEGLCSKKVADLNNFWDGQRFIKLLDPNILACKDREDLFKQLINSNAEIDYTQGLDARFIDDDIANLISQTKIKMIHFAFDLMKNEERILSGLKIFAKYFKKDRRHKRVYVLTNFNTSLQEDYYRVKKIIELGYSPYVMIYQKGTQPKFLTDLARWSNNMFLLNATSFEDYVPRKNSKPIKELYSHILK